MFINHQVPLKVNSSLPNLTKTDFLNYGGTKFLKKNYIQYIKLTDGILLYYKLLEGEE